MGHEYYAETSRAQNAVLRGTFEEATTDGGSTIRRGSGTFSDGKDAGAK